MFLFVLCMLVQDSLVDQPQAEGLGVIQKNFDKFNHPGGREAARLFSLQLFLFTNTISAKPGKNCLTIQEL